MIKVYTHHKPNFVIMRINSRKDELVGKLRITNSQWEIEEEYFDEVMGILDELGLKFTEQK